MAKFFLARGSESAFRFMWTRPWTRWIGFRYLRSKKNSRFLSFITLLSTFGVGLGVMSMIIVLSVMEGFEEKTRARLMSTDLHILVTPTVDTPGFDRGFLKNDAIDPQRITRFRKSEPLLKDLWAVTKTEAILKTGRKVSGVELKGVSDRRLEVLRKQIVESAEEQMLYTTVQGVSSRLPGVIVGQELAYEMGLIPGDRVTLISPTETEGPLGAVPRLKRFVVEAVYSSGLPDQELQVVFLRKKAVYSFLRKRDVVSHWEATLKDFEAARGVGHRMKQAFPELRIQDWFELNERLLGALQLERIVMFVILAFIVVVASFNIVTTLTLMVLEKKREISILKAMGARHGEVAAVFLSEGFFIGLVGIVGGMVAGTVLCAILKRYEFITLPDVYYDRTLPVSFEPMYYILVSVAAVLIVLLACLYPSRRAAQVNPIDGVRFG